MQQILYQGRRKCIIHDRQKKKLFDKTRCFSVLENKTRKYVLIQHVLHTFKKINTSS